MPETAAPPRTRLVKTSTEELQTIDANATKGLDGKPWKFYLDDLDDPQLAITTIYIYRREPLATEGFIVKLNPALRIDEDWIGQRYGGGTYDVTIRTKPDVSHLERNVKIDPLVYGDPKLSDKEKATGAGRVANAAPAGASTPTQAMEGVMNRLLDRMDKTDERIERILGERQPAAPQSSAAQDAGFKLITEAASESIKLVADQVKRDNTPPPPPAPSLADKLMEKALDRLFAAPPADSEEKLLSKMKIFKDIFAPAAGADSLKDKIVEAAIKRLLDGTDAGGATGDWKAALITTLGERVPDLVDGAKALLEAKTKSDQAAAAAVQARANAAVAVANAGRTAVAQPAASAPAPGKPTPVTPIDTGRGPAWAPTPDYVNTDGTQAPPPAEPAAPAAADPGSQEDAMIERRVKQRVLALIVEDAPPEMVLDVIDGMMPVVGSLLSRISDKQIREFIEKDEILAEATKLPHYERYLRQLIQIVRGEEEVEETPAPKPN